MTALHTTPAERARGAAGAALLVGGILWLLISGLTVHQVAALRDELNLFQVTPDRTPPPEKPVPERKVRGKPEGAAAPPNLRAKPTDIVAPPIPAPTPPPIAAAPVASTSTAPSAGAAPVAGPGTGAGGQGNGLGSGGSGDGEGRGGGSPPRWIKGSPKDSDYPSHLSDQGVGGTVTIRYIVGVDGRVSTCSVLVSSGNAELDTVTCNAIVKRSRFKPARDNSGKPVPATIVENQTWVPHSRPDEDPERE